MNGKNRKILLALAFVLVFSTGVYASGTVKQITAKLCPDIKVFLDGKEQTFKDAKGNTVYPISYNNSTYLPIRAIGGIMGENVEWDQAKNSIYLGDKASDSAVGNKEVSKNNVNIQTTKAEDGTIVGVLKNESSKTMAKVRVDITFYDESGKMMGVDDAEFNSITANSSVVCVLECLNSEYDQMEFDHFDVQVKVDEKANDYKSYMDKITIVDSMAGEKVIAKFTNNSDKKIDVCEAMAVFYKDKKLVGVSDSTTILYLGAGETVSKEFKPPLNEKYRAYGFDSYKIYINGAYSY